VQELARPIQPGHDSGSTGRQAVGARALGRTLVSDTTEIFTGSSGVSEASPGQSGAPEGRTAEDAATGAAASGAPPTRGAAAGETVTDRAARRGGSGLSGMLLPELQRLAW